MLDSCKVVWCLVRKEELGDSAAVYDVYGVLYSVTCATLFWRVYSFLFKLCTYVDLNSTVAVLRGFVYYLFLQERALLRISSKTNNEKRLFENLNVLRILRCTLK
jgi:hypothetical protein